MQATFRVRPSSVYVESADWQRDLSAAVNCGEEVVVCAKLQVRRLFMILAPRPRLMWTHDPRQARELCSYSKS